EVVDAYNATTTDGPATASAIDLKGVRQTLNVFDVEGTFVLIDGSRPMFVATQPDVIGNPRGAIVTLSAENQDLTRFTSIAHVVSGDNSWSDPVAVSAHVNMGAVFEYYLQTFGRLSIDGRGGSMFSVIHVTNEGRPMDNAFWNGVFMAYGDGNVAFEPLAEALDVAAHEMTHGVIQHTVNLE
ncbi:MAG: neutral protease, partial [Candidatus Latescibacterota bacterium]